MQHKWFHHEQHLRQMFELKTAMKRIRGRIRLNKGVRSDLMRWALFLDAWNEVSMLRDHIQQRETVDLRTDASGSIGCGTWIPASGEWLLLRREGQMLLTPQIAQEGITLKELMLIILACTLLRRYWVCGIVKAHCDNTRAVAVVNSGYSRSEPMFHLLRCLFLLRHSRVETALPRDHYRPRPQEPKETHSGRCPQHGRI